MEKRIDCIHAPICKIDGDGMCPLECGYFIRDYAPPEGDEIRVDRCIVCEWKETSRLNNSSSYRTECGELFVAERDDKTVNYCPNCGGRIKKVGKNGRDITNAKNAKGDERAG